MSPSRLEKLASFTTWRLRRHERRWLQTTLAPGLHAILARGEYIPPLLLAELLRLDAPEGAVRRSPAPRPESAAWKSCLTSLHERAADMRRTVSTEGVSSGLGTRLVRGLLRVLHMHDLQHEQRFVDADAMLARHLDDLEDPTGGFEEPHLLESELAVERFLESRLAAAGSLLELLGPAFSRVVPPPCPTDYVDPALGVLLDHDSLPSGRAPNTTTHHEGGDLPRTVRSPVGVFLEWSGGPLPASLRVHPLMWMYKDVSPAYFSYLAGQGQIRQAYGAAAEPSNRCAHILVDIDLYETAAMHRFRHDSGHAAPISFARAVLCTVLHNLAVRAIAHGFLVSFRLRRWAPGAVTPSRTGRVVISQVETAAFADSPHAVRDWLTLEFPELVLTRSVSPISVRRHALDSDHFDHHARLILGEVPANLRYARDPDDDVHGLTSVGMKLQPLSHEHCRFAFAPPIGLPAADLTNEIPFDSVGQLARLATECCLSTTSGDLAGVVSASAQSSAG